MLKFPTLNDYDREGKQATGPCSIVAKLGCSYDTAPSVDGRQHSTRNPSSKSTVES